MSDGLVETIVSDHALRDEKDRAIGGCAYIQKHLKEFPTLSGWRRESLAEWSGSYTVRIQATRNGKEFGAYVSPSGVYSTLEEARLAAEMKLSKQRARYYKLYGHKVNNKRSAP